MKYKRKGIGWMLLLVFSLFFIAGCGKTSEPAFLFAPEGDGQDALPVFSRDSGTAGLKETAAQEVSEEEQARADIMVYICGCVKVPGVYALPPDARVLPPTPVRYKNRRRRHPHPRP